MRNNDMQFDREELQILRDFERGEFQRIENFQIEKRELEAVARDAMGKDRTAPVQPLVREHPYPSVALA